jgi:outer membrane lipoprotein SlyB
MSTSSPLSRRLGLVALLGASLALGACAHQQRQSYDSGYYQGGYGSSYSAHRDHERGGYERNGYGHIQYGHVRAIEVVGDGRRDGGRSSGGGALVGGIIGGLIGNQMGKGDGRAAATVIGAVGGAVIGNEIEQQQDRERTPRYQHGDREGARPLYRVLVRLQGRGSEMRFETEHLDGLRVGDRVRVENGRLRPW